MPAQDLNLQPNSPEHQNTPPKANQRTQERMMLANQADKTPKTLKGGVKMPKPLADVAFPDPQDMFKPVDSTAGVMFEPNAGVKPSKALAKQMRDKEAALVLQSNQPPKPVPPHTAQQYVQQFRPIDTEMYPEVSDIFRGKVPGQVPLTGIVDTRLPSQMPRVVPPPPQTVIVEHKLPDQASAYQVTRDFMAYVGETMCNFTKGQIVYDVTVLDSLFRGNCQYLVPFGTMDDYEQCPVCRHMFPGQRGSAR